MRKIIGQFRADVPLIGQLECGGSLNHVERVQELQWTGGRAHRSIADVQIAGGGLQICVAEQDLNGAEIYARIQQVSGEGVSCSECG